MIILVFYTNFIYFIYLFYIFCGLINIVLYHNLLCFVRLLFTDALLANLESRTNEKDEGLIKSEKRVRRKTKEKRLSKHCFSDENRRLFVFFGSVSFFFGVRVKKLKLRLKESRLKCVKSSGSST